VIFRTLYSFITFGITLDGNIYVIYLLVFILNIKITILDIHFIGYFRPGTELLLLLLLFFLFLLG